MVSKNLTIPYILGFHLRPASYFSGVMEKYPCDVKINFNGNCFNAKSTLQILAACIKCGSTIELVCDGEQENEALSEGTKIIEEALGD